MWYKVYIVCSELINDSDTAYGLYVASISLIIVAQSFMTCCLIVADLWSSHWCGKFTVKWETFSCELVLVSQMVYAKSPACRNRQLPHLQLIFFFFFYWFALSLNRTNYLQADWWGKAANEINNGKSDIIHLWQHLRGSNLDLFIHATSVN